ncbi:MAG: AFG1 family ATPase [Wenzhouxiangellaceae bacterium]|nr:AFG1 family ATPase [Wenzhouxiangellaceae bacterium]MBS3824558.1 AFG1 family ATPase [Wenzhouxiangellaceae bacterium]
MESFRSAGAAGPAGRYQALVDAGKLKFDERQEHVAEALQHCHDAVVKHTGGWFRRPQRVPGVYIHGGVGTGKTLLMDLFVQALQTAGVSVERAHFHRFMDDVHTRLKQLGNRSSPLSEIAAAQRKRARVLCFDEFHVEDIADAMLLGELSTQWFERGVTLVATSNQAPDRLYADGLQRRRFEPAIENIEANCRVVELDAAEDFRLRELERHPTWYVPADEENERLLAAEFEALCPDQPVSTGHLDVRGRELPIRRRSGSLLWADFADLCEGPRSASDYIELSYRFSTLIVSNIPVLDDDRNNAARRFIHLVDECYDHAVKLIATAEAPIERIYTGNRLADPFQRTISRLVEMQSKEYLSLAHRS